MNLPFTFVTSIVLWHTKPYNHLIVVRISFPVLDVNIVQPYLADEILRCIMRDRIMRRTHRINYCQNKIRLVRLIRKEHFKQTSHTLHLWNYQQVPNHVPCPHHETTYRRIPVDSIKTNELILNTRRR